MKWFRKKLETIEYNKFIVSIQTNSHFLIRYPRKDYTPRLGECLSGKWGKTINVIKKNLLFIEIYVSNQKNIIDLICELKIEELDGDDNVINTSNFLFNVGTGIKNLVWNRFEVKSILE